MKVYNKKVSTLKLFRVSSWKESTLKHFLNYSKCNLRKLVPWIFVGRFKVVGFWIYKLLMIDLLSNEYFIFTRLRESLFDINQSLIFFIFLLNIYCDKTFYFLSSWKRFLLSTNIIGFDILKQDRRSSTLTRKIAIQEWRPAVLHV